MITKGYYNNEHLLKHQTYCPQLVAEQTFFSDFTIQSYSWIRMHQSMGRITKRFFNDGGQNGESCLFIGGYGRMYGREK